MHKRIVLPVSLLLMTLGALPITFITLVGADPAVIRVPADYPTIQGAVDAANTGDIVLVSAGTYYEHVKVNKTVSLVGKSRETTIIDGNRTGDVLYVTADNVKIGGFTIQNGGGFGGSWACGIVLDHSNGSIIYANTIASNVFGGVGLKESFGNIISGNQILNNGGGPPGLKYGEGIWLGDSNSNIISNNSISNNVVGGIGLSSSHDNIVVHNTVTKHELEGVGLYSSAGNIISDNMIISNGAGISLIGSTGNTIKHNQILENGGGIGMGYSEMNVIKENNISENTGGIGISHKSPNNTVVGNTISNNLNGVEIHYSNGSIIHHNNLINNTINVPEDVYPNVNTWDDGYPSGGNYWSDYPGQDFYAGPYQSLTGSDGIGDTAHTIYANNRDRFPLMGPVSIFDAGTWNGETYNVDVVSNSTVSDFYFNPKEGAFIRFNVTGLGNIGFSRVTIPKAMLWVEDGQWTVLVNNTAVPYTLIEDGNYTYLYFTYYHSAKTVEIRGTGVVPEFPTWISIILILTILTVAGAFARARARTTKIFNTQDRTASTGGISLEMVEGRVERNLGGRSKSDK